MVEILKKFTTQFVVLALSIALFSTNSASQPTPEDLRLLENDSSERPWVAYSTASCPPSLGGEGSTHQNPIIINDFFDLLSSALTWANPEEGRNTNQWEQENDQAITHDLNCKWVKISGHFRRDYYQHYRGVFADSANSFYTEDGGPGNNIRNRLYTIESWADPNIRSALINGTDIEIVAQFYDLCRVAYTEVEKANDGRIIMGGPCHYGRFTGLMLRDAHIKNILSVPLQRIHGETNRNIIGDIQEIPKTWPEYETVKATAIEILEKIRRGPLTYWNHRLSRWMEPNSEDILRRAHDADNWISFLSKNKFSPLHPSKNLIEENEFRLYRLKRYGGGETEEHIKITFACFCTRPECTDHWPLFADYAESFHDKTLCFRIDRDYRNPTNWE